MAFQQEVRWLLQEKYNGKRNAVAAGDIARLAQGEHVDYVIGWVDFLGCRIDLSQKPFIPRPETEYWVERAIGEIQTFSRRLRVLDMFAGSGCIGIAILKHVPGARLDFAEKEQGLLRQIEINAALNGIDKNRYRVFQSDIFSGVQGTYDYILANPPYVAEARKAQVQQSVLEQEPFHAVFAGEDGLRYIRPFLKQAKNYVRPGGVVYLEFDSPQRAKVRTVAKHAGATNAELQRDQYNKWRYARIVF